MELKQFNQVKVNIDFSKRVETVDFGITTAESIYADSNNEADVDNLLVAIFKLIDKTSRNVHIDLTGQNEGNFSQEYAIKGYRFDSEFNGNSVAFMTDIIRGHYQKREEVEYDSRIKMINALKKDIKATIIESLNYKPVISTENAI